jgi:hypothetical protein
VFYLLLDMLDVEENQAVKKSVRPSHHLLLSSTPPPNLLHSFHHLFLDSKEE